MMVNRRAPAGPLARLAGGAALALLGAAPARAQLVPGAPSLTVTAASQLRFGIMVVPVSGSRTLGADGSVGDAGVIPVASGATSPAEFTVIYDRGGQGTQPLTITLQILLSAAPPVLQNGVVARLSAFTSDLPGAPVLVAGTPVTATISNCVTRTCALTFHIGGRLDVLRAFGSANLAFSLPVTALVTQVQG
ncbi:MAG: DUF4402 domain-containing protein [Proteobacteria bacterium]|nr:DUF4402 domain-containing protein [Pseudomonadota bacterium]